MSQQTSHLPEAHARAANRAGGSSFYFAMRILRRDQREAMFEIYSFCRAVDDIADSDTPRDWRMDRLAHWRQDIAAIYEGRVPSEREGLADAIHHFSLHRQDFLAIIDGMEMDASADIRAPDAAKLELYCDRVACAVGRLSVCVFGMEEREGRGLAHHLGLALQFTNILRDIDEDAAIGRLYLPREALQLANIVATDPLSTISDPRLGIACTFVADVARDHFAKSEEIMSRCPRHVVRAPKIMAEVYRQILEDMIVRGWMAPRRRVHAHKLHLLWVALRHAVI
jgi:squalene synthase HpnD